MKSRSIELLKKYDVRLKKSLGQNLLLDPNINRMMVEVAGIDRADTAFEVGAGIGDLTEVLAGRAAQVLTVEIDSRFEAPLQERFMDNPRVSFLIGDILSYPIRGLLDRYVPNAKNLKMVSNLPYYITSPILMHFLESDAEFVSLTVMVQKEVAERIVAVPGGKEYGILSIACQLYAEPYIAHTVSPKCFRPIPNVDSAIVHLPIREQSKLNTADRPMFFTIVSAAFGQRRKKIINALASFAGSLPGGKEHLQQLLLQSGIPPDSRAETIPVARFIHLASLAAEHRATAE
jgi:16S rRNA (adenine1518-N6/adenine1519-N6)-dimethyltransferase